MHDICMVTCDRAGYGICGRAKHKYPSRMLHNHTETECMHSSSRLTFSLVHRSSGGNVASSNLTQLSRSSIVKDCTYGLIAESLVLSWMFSWCCAGDSVVSPAIMGVCCSVLLSSDILSCWVFTRAFLISLRSLGMSVLEKTE